MKKIIIIILVIVIAFVIVALAAGNIFGLFPFLQASSNTPPDTFDFPSNTTHVPSLTAITYDFNNGIPILLEGHNTPFIQKSGGVEAYFSSPSDPAAFSIQSYDTTFYTLSQFSGNYLFDNKIPRDKLYISFSQPISSITLTFATVEYYGAGHVDEPSYMKLTAYKDSMRTIIGSNSAQGIMSDNIFPQGTLSYDAAGQFFNLIQIELLPQQPGGTDFLVDNIRVTTA